MVIRVEEAIVDAWSYADAYPQEITAAIRVNNELTIGYSIG